MRRAFKYRLYPTRDQERRLHGWLGLCRQLYNAALEERREAWKQGVSITFADQSRQLPEIKKLRPECAQVYAQVFQNVLVRLNETFQRFFERVKRGDKPGYPRFKNRDRYRSLTWPQAPGFSLRGAKHLRLSGIGELRIKLHRPVEGRPKTCTVKSEAGKWYAAFSCDDVKSSKVLYPVPGQEVGVDLGLESFATLSTGVKVPNPRWYRKTQEKIALAQRELSRKKRGSRRRAKTKLLVARLHEKARRQREDFQHKLANRLVSENQLIVVEDLKIRALMENSSKGLATSIQDAAWWSFLSKLAVKAVEAGRRLVKVPPEGTSSTCFACGAIRRKDLSERLHECPCGLKLDRDLNASLNILRLGRSLQALA
jgi:putative transposase